MLQKISYECFDNIINHLCIHFLEKRFDKDLRLNQKSKFCHIFYNEMKDLLYLSMVSKGFYNYINRIEFWIPLLIRDFRDEKSYVRIPLNPKEIYIHKTKIFLKKNNKLIKWD